ncbi:MAG: thioesterase family protein [Ilumatobacteraceae bacterium]
MGDFGLDTAVERVDERRYRGSLSSDWEIWGPCGGYVTSVALRAAGESTSFRRPASFSCHFLGVARFDEIDVEVTSLRAGRRSESLRVSMTQGDRHIAELLVWAVDQDAEGVTLDWVPAADHPPPGDVPTIQERMDDWRAWYPFWKNFEYRPLEWRTEQEYQAARPLEPTWEAWFRYLPTSVFDDPWIEAGRVSLLADVAFWPAISRAIPAEQGDNWIAPSLDVAVSFHQMPEGSEYLWLDAHAPIAADGLGGGTARIRGDDGRLLCSATQQMLFRRVDPSMLPG